MAEDRQHPAIPTLQRQFAERRFDRREFLRTATLLGMSSAAAYGFDKVLFGIIMIVNLEIGFLTPPVGLNLLVAMSTFKQKFAELVVAATPFIVLMLACLALISWQPWIAMSLVR